MTDYRRFLKQEAETMVLPYLGGPYVDARDRRLRASGATSTGYWRFEVSGRTATAVEPADPPDLSDLPAVRGYWVAGYLVGERAVAYRLAMGPGAAGTASSGLRSAGSAATGATREDGASEGPAARARGASAIYSDPMRFAPVIARRWPGGALLYDTEDFETGVEDRVRAVFDGLRGPQGEASRAGLAGGLRGPQGEASRAGLAGCVLDHLDSVSASIGGQPVRGG
jgi:hypothetical protein